METESKLIGQGSYGCIYHKPLPCSTTCQSKDCQDGIGKLMSITHADKEKQELSFIDKIDPNFDFHIGLADTCQVNSVPNDTCTEDHDFSNSTMLEQLIYQYGGVSLIDFLNQDLPQTEIKKLVASFGNIFEGLIIMRANNFYHLDIKLDNIVVKKVGDNYELKLIDFGLSKHITNFNDCYDSIFRFIYPSWPPEAVLLTSNDVPNEAILNYCYDYDMDSNMTQLLRHYPFIDGSKLAELIESEIIEPRPVLNGLIYDSIDSFSLGFVLLQICAIIEDNEFKTQLCYLALGMTDLRLFDRLSIDDATALYKSMFMD